MSNYDRGMRVLKIMLTACLVALLPAGCGSNIQEEAEDIFRQCIEDSGGTAGDFEGYIEDGQLLLVAGPIDADADTFDYCFDFTNEQLAGD